MIRNKDVFDKLEKIEEMFGDFAYQLERINRLEERISEVFNEVSFEQKMLFVSNALKDAIDQTKDNVNKVNLMTTELKGVVSMSRASLNEGKGFIELVKNFVEMVKHLKSFE